MLNEGTPLISVITVVYNGAKEIENTILSVLNQTYPHIEYIIIDGGSQDGTVDIIKKYEQYLSYWISEPDSGIYYAMNKGIDIATGEWIHFRNCGDLFFCNESVQSLFSRPITSEIIMLHGNSRFIYANGMKDLTPSILSHSYKHSMPVFHPSTFIRSSLHKARKYNVKYKSSADYEFVYYCFEQRLEIEYRPVLVSIYNCIDGFSLTNWKLARREIWDWKFSNFVGKMILIELDILILSCRRNMGLLKLHLLEKMKNVKM